MTVDQSEITNSIDSAIEACKTTISTHRRSSTFLLLGVIAALFGFFSYFLFVYQDSRYSYKERLEEANKAYREASTVNDSLNSLLPDSLKLVNLQKKSEPYIEIPKSESGTSFINYGIYLFGVVIISILTALYRLHIKEIGKAEQNLIAFYRIRIAGNNYQGGFASEVREALTFDAFYNNNSESGFFSKSKKVDSPIPGHPGSDIVTAVINKLLENVEIKPKS